MPCAFLWKLRPCLLYKYQNHIVTCDRAALLAFFPFTRLFLSILFLNIGVLKSHLFFILFSHYTILLNSCICSLGFILQLYQVTCVSPLQPKSFSWFSDPSTQESSRPRPVASSRGLRLNSSRSPWPPKIYSCFFILAPPGCNSDASFSVLSSPGLAHLPSLESVFLSSVLQLRLSLSLLYFPLQLCGTILTVPSTSSLLPFHFILYSYSRIILHSIPFLLCEISPCFFIA